ncbi:hypothetical protein BX070DRAFT_220649, partial [Coemansia spiralis]
LRILLSGLCILCCLPTCSMIAATIPKSYFCCEGTAQKRRPLSLSFIKRPCFNRNYPIRGLASQTPNMYISVILETTASEQKIQPFYLKENPKNVIVIVSLYLYKCNV